MDRASRFMQMCSGMGVTLSDRQCENLFWLLDELLRWNASINLTSITDPAEAQIKHLLDSLSLVPLLGEGLRVLDMGSGGGFPGLPLKIARPDLRIISVDSVQKKIAFQKHVVRSLHLKDFEPWHGRVEELARKRPELGQGFDLVVSRAFTALDNFARHALPYVSRGGRILAMKGPEGEAELTRAAALLEQLGLECTGFKELELPLAEGKRTLIVLERR